MLQTSRHEKAAQCAAFLFGVSSIFKSDIKASDACEQAANSALLRS
ncbi:hypothetical protein QF043_000215 [Pseudomonas sp. W3I7]|nr:hypothetical protein [Pseudomonas sp. W3I7]MDQ0701423.1 hypothetical protein [Pseudomonas sp. W3I7]